MDDIDLRHEPPLPVLVANRADEVPDRVFVEEVGGPSLTYADVDRRGRTWAGALRNLGVSPGDRVLTMVDPGVTSLCAWLGIAWLGAIDVGVNTQYRGSMLQYLLADSQARVAVVDAAYVARMGEIDLAGTNLEVVVVAGNTCEAGAVTGARKVSVEELLATASATDELARPGRHDIACLIYTSGTTGPSKGVRVPWAQLAATNPAQWHSGAGADEAYYVPFPAYHVAGRAPACLMARHAGRVVYRRRFSVEAFWTDIRRHECTFCLLAGSVPSMLLRQPERPDDADNPMRVVLMAPVIAEHRRFAERFGVRLVTGYNMTETSTPFINADGIVDHESCGRLRKGYPSYEVRIVDDHDHEVPDGDVGQLIVRTGVPWTLNDGYHGRPEATLAAWRNGWFHTGDAFRRDGDGNYFFVDRQQDVIRRRGENISSFEVETLVGAHPAVAECAAVAVPSDLGEDEVCAFVVPAAGRFVDPAAVHADLSRTMPRFMVPRYIVIVDDLPKTEATLRVQKAKLRTVDLAAAWDSAAAGAQSG